MKENDAPNWFGIGFSLIVWPIFLVLLTHILSKRKMRRIPNLRVDIRPGQTTINGQRFDEVHFSFVNNTGLVIYLTEAYLRVRSNTFPIPAQAVRDISGRGHELKFDDGTGRLVLKELVIQTR